MATLTAKGSTVLARAEAPMNPDYSAGKWRLVLRSDGKILRGGTGYGYTIAATVDRNIPGGYRNTARMEAIFCAYAVRRGYIVIEIEGEKR